MLDGDVNTQGHVLTPNAVLLVVVVLEVAPGVAREF
jgi:hypothetical protein